MKKIMLIVSLILSLNSFANCRPEIEQDLMNRITRSERVDHIGKITTGATFVVVGGFYGTMGVVLLGPLWAGVIVGASFGTAAALPVGTVFVISHQMQKRTIQNHGKTLSIIDGAHEFESLFKLLEQSHPNLTREELQIEIAHLNESKALCDGTVARFDRLLPTRKLIAHPKDILRWLGQNLPVTPLIH